MTGGDTLCARRGDGRRKASLTVRTPVVFKRGWSNVLAVGNCAVRQRNPVLV
jgi:hypothetical protein